MSEPLGTARDDVDLRVNVHGRVALALATRALTEGKTADQLVGEALARHLAQLGARSATSRNAREGRYVGFALGQHVRWRHARRRRVRRAKALAVLYRRREQQIDLYLARNP